MLLEAMFQAASATAEKPRFGGRTGRARRGVRQFHEKHEPAIAGGGDEARGGLGRVSSL